MPVRRSLRAAHLTRPFLASLAAAALTLTVALQPTAAADGAAGFVDPAAATMIATELTLLELTNADRVANGLEPLQFDPETLAIARERAASQLQPAPLTHYDANGDLAFVNMFAAANIPYGLAGENLARSTANNAAVTQRVETALMNSPDHRRNILEKRFKRVAIGAASDASGTITFAEVYRD
jgi:uncharacterized protein YkwD